MKRQTLSTTTHFHTYSTGEAWQKVNELFHTDYDHDPERSREEEKKAVEEMESNPSAEVRCLVLTADQNAKVMLDCMRDCVRAVKVLTDKTDDVDAWMVAGCNAAISKASEDRIIPYDLPASLCGMLGADYRKSTKEEK